jgi:ribosomal protein S18 acetylase RimI-like enzyme
VATSLGDRAADRITLQQVSFAHPEVQRLVVDVQAEYTTIYGGGDDTPLDLTEFDPPAGAFLLAQAASPQQAVAMGGWRFRPDVEALGGVRAAEIKRMYVVPTHRGRGLAQLMLASLEESARDAGGDVMVLETGRPQIAAVALYLRAGYVDAGVRFGHYAHEEHALYLGKRLPRVS